jgi:hypothetical protein
VAVGQVFSEYFSFPCQSSVHQLLYSHCRWSVKLLLAFAGIIIPGFRLHMIHDQDFCSLLDMYMFRNGAFSSFYVGTKFVALQFQHEYICNCIILIQDIQRFSVNACLCSRLLLNFYNHPEAAVYQPNCHRPDCCQAYVTYTSYVWLLLIQCQAHFGLHDLGLLLPVSHVTISWSLFTSYRIAMVPCLLAIA